MKKNKAKIDIVEKILNLFYSAIDCEALSIENACDKNEAMEIIGKHRIIYKRKLEELFIEEDKLKLPKPEMLGIDYNLKSKNK